MSDAAHVCWIQIYNTNSDQTNETTGMHRKMSSGSGSELCNTRIFFTKYIKSGTAKKDAHPTLSPRTILKMGAYWPKNGQQKSLPEGHQLDRSEVFCPAPVRYCWSIQNT